MNRKKAIYILGIVALAVAGSSVAHADSDGRATLAELAGRELPSLRDQVGAAETVDLHVYFVGFPAELAGQLEQAVAERLGALSIVDTKPWWIPRMPLFGQAEFDTAPAPESLPAELIPPDGLIRYEGGSLTRGTNPATGAAMWLPNREINDSVDDWHHHNDIVYYMEHDGAYTGVAWQIEELTFSHLPAATLADLYPVLSASQVEYVSRNPQQTFQLYSYNRLMDWIDGNVEIEERRGGATLVFLNLPPLAEAPYSFYIEPQEDRYAVRATAPAEVQYPEVTAADPSYQQAADVMAAALGGGLTQAKMLAALEVVCPRTTTVAQAGLAVPGAADAQSLCEQWQLEPIPNLLGNKMRRYYVSDSTRELAGFDAGELAASELVDRVAGNAYELYRYGVLQPSLQADNPYSQAYELRMLVVDLRYDETDACILSRVEAEADPAACLDSSDGFETEKSYELADVFDAELATRSLAEFVPASWTVTTVPFPFGMQPDGTIDRVAGAQTKAALRRNLDRPTFPNPRGGDPIVVTHPPLYRELSFVNPAGGFDTLTASWEFGISSNVAQTLFTAGREAGGLGIYETIWPEARAIGEEPFHRTGRAPVKPLVFIMTPSPSGPRGEKWGTFPHTLAGGIFLTTWGGGGWWSSVAGNESGGAIFRRDFFTLVPQYFLGRDRGNGSADPLGVMPDGTVQSMRRLSGLTHKALDIAAIHWVDQFDSSDPAERALARSFVREVSTLQALETLQHGLGYMHAPEPRRRFHFDGEFSSLGRMYELAQNRRDVTGALLHRFVNQYTTHGISTVWCQCTSEWNGVAPQTGMQTTMFRSHARAAVAAAEQELRHALDQAAGQSSVAESTVEELRRAVAAHEAALVSYDDWEYAATIAATWRMLHHVDRALTAIGQPDRIHDPLEALGSFPFAGG